MTLSLYDATVPQFLQTLRALPGLLDKAEAHCREHNLAETDLTEAALAPDMWVFAKQVDATCAHSAGALAATQSGEFHVDFTPPPSDFASLRAKVASAIASIEALDAQALDAVTGRDTAFVIGTMRRMDFTTPDYLLSFALPNFHFHAAAAYAILRAKGVNLTKGDFLGQPRYKG